MLAYTFAGRLYSRFLGLIVCTCNDDEFITSFNSVLCPRVYIKNLSSTGAIFLSYAIYGLIVFNLVLDNSPRALSVEYISTAY